MTPFKYLATAFAASFGGAFIEFLISLVQSGLLVRSVVGALILLPFVFASAFLFGLPLYWLQKRYSSMSFFWLPIYAAAGGVGAILVPYFLFLNSTIPQDMFDWEQFKLLAPMSVGTALFAWITTRFGYFRIESTGG